MPDTIQFSNGKQIVNRYAADGRKLGTEFFTQLAALAQPLVEGQVKKQQYSSGFVDQSGIMYINNFEYKTQYGSASMTSLNKVFNAEGYVDEFANNTSYSGFCYYRTDHLGNVCEVWRAAKPGGALAATLQKTFYFPSGLPLSYSTSPGLQPNKYNNKPFIEMHGYDNYDYSARMMYPAIGSRFMSVDPLAEKYYSISPYVYCAGNPIIFIDSDGQKILYANSSTEEFKKAFSQAVQHLKKHGASGMIVKLEKSDKVYYISETSGGSSYSRKANTISWDPTKAVLTNEVHELSPTTILNHEVDHALQHDKNPEQQKKDAISTDAQYGNKEEKRVIEGAEQETARKLGEIRDGEVTRKDHGGTLYKTNGPTSTEWKNAVIVTPKKDEEIK